MKRLLFIWLVLVLVGCGATPQTVEVTRIVEVPAEGGEVAQVEVTREVTVEVTREVEVEVEIVVTATSEPATPTPEPSPTVESEVALEVGSYTGYRTQFGTLYVVGEILNNGNVPTTVEAAVTVLDADGQVLGSSSINLAELRAVLPGETFPLQFFMDEVTGDYASIEIQVNGEPLEDSFIFAPYFNLEAGDVTDSIGQFGWWVLAGRVNNTGEGTAELVKVVVVAYDGAGAVMDVASTYVDLDSIPPGSNASFSIDFPNQQAAPASYTVYAQGTLAQE